MSITLEINKAWFNVICKSWLGKKNQHAAKIANCSLYQQENGNIASFYYDTVTSMILIVHAPERKEIDKLLLKEIYL